jgi:hypothetical protein
MDPSKPIPVLDVTDAVRPRLLAGAPRLLEICQEAYAEDGRAQAAGIARPPHVVEFVTGAAFVLERTYQDLAERLIRVHAFHAADTRGQPVQ